MRPAGLCRICSMHKTKACPLKDHIAKHGRVMEVTRCLNFKDKEYPRSVVDEWSRPS